MIFKKLIENREDFSEWMENIKDDFYLMENTVENPENYPCVVVYYGEICDTPRDNLYYEFVYLSDFQ